MKAMLLMGSLILLIGIGTACQKPATPEETKPVNTTNNTPVKATETNVNEVAVIKTSQGEMVIEFWADVAPKTVENFKKLARQGFYDGTAFHRIVKGFMIQGGDPLTKDPKEEERWGTGGPGYTIAAEFNSRPHVRGVISMARSPDPDSAGSQFFICLANAKFLDGDYTTFGKLVQGDEVLGKIGETPVVVRGNEASKPTVRINVESIKIVPAASLNLK